MIPRNLVVGDSRDAERAEGSAFERCRLEYEAAADAARSAITAMTSMRQRMLDLSQRKGAARADAETARTHWSRLLRDSDGVLTADLEALRASERSSLSLADEYQAMCEELEPSLLRCEVAAADLANTALSKRRAAVSAAAEDALGDLQLAIRPHFEHAYGLFRREQAETMPAGERHLDKEALMAFVSRLSALLSQNSSPPAQQTYESIGISELRVEDIPHELLHSPVRRSMARELSKKSGLN